MCILQSPGNNPEALQGREGPAGAGLASAVYASWGTTKSYIPYHLERTQWD